MNTLPLVSCLVVYLKAHYGSSISSPYIHEEQLNRDFNFLCEWFIDNKLSTHFGEEKTKSILFGTKGHLKNQTDLNIKYGDIKIEQHSKVTYLGLYT